MTESAETKPSLKGREPRMPNDSIRSSTSGGLPDNSHGLTPINPGDHADLIPKVSAQDRAKIDEFFRGLEERVLGSRQPQK